MREQGIQIINTEPDKKDSYQVEGHWLKIHVLGRNW